ncbi:MAG TPA: manganese-dependent inorganic pyrophosphatase [Candidatus Nanoarchaeia archaeon]|nr:manganese-dependent inorganic pyrophosphatase [Candidatus Nanoarchaeia archaeon]
MVIYSIGHKNPDTDSVCGAIAIADLENQLGNETIPCMQGELNPETKFVLKKFNVSVPKILTDGEGKKLILVDHTEVTQTVNNIGKAEIVGIIDHHKLGDITTSTPLEVLIRPLGSTCTIIKQLYNLYDKVIPKEIAGIMLCAILSDTVIFKSVTTTFEDKKVVDELAKIAGIKDIKKLGMEMFKVKSAIEGASIKDLVLRDYKDFDMNGHKVGIGQLELIDLSLVEKIKDDLYEEIKKMKGEGRHSVFLLLTDIMKEGTEMLYVTDDSNIIKKAFNKKPEKKSVWLDGVMSRKKQVVPPLEKAFS